MSDRNLDDLHPSLKPLCRDWLDTCHKQGIDVRVYMTYRSPEEQNALYALGRTKPGKVVTNAKGGQSPHNVTLDGKPASCAFDWFLENPDGSANWNTKSTEWQTAVVIGKHLALTWGGDFPKNLYDADHFELAQWREIAYDTKNISS